MPSHEAKRFIYRGTSQQHAVGRSSFAGTDWKKEELVLQFSCWVYLIQNVTLKSLYTIHFFIAALHNINKRFVIHYLLRVTRSTTCVTSSPPDSSI